jgi:magnesium chelatase subunit D
VGAEGLRADLVICRAAAALAGWEGRTETAADDVRRVAPMALAHRARRAPLEDHGIDPHVLEEALSGAGLTGPERVDPPAPPSRVVRLEAPRAPQGLIPPSAGKRSVAEGPRGRLVADRVPGAGGPETVALGATVRAAVARRSGEGQSAARPLVAPSDLREAVREQRAGNLVVLAVDASGSMGAKQRMEAAKGAVLSLLVDAYQRRDRVALVTFRGDGATTVLRPTGSIEVARARLVELPTGGRTPLAAGIRTALDLARAGTGDAHQPLLVLVTDGRATAGPDGVDPVEAAAEAAASVRRAGVGGVVIDAEDGPGRLGLARRLAEAMGARYLTVPELSATSVVDAVRRSAAPSR